MRRDALISVVLDRDGDPVEVTVLVEHHYRFGGWSAASETQGWQGGVAVDLTYAEQHAAEQLALREHGNADA